MKINKNQFIDKLDRIKGALATSGDDAQKSFMFASGKVFSYNEMAFAATSLEGCDFELSVPGKKLIDLVKKLKAGELDISFDGNTLMIKAGRSTSKIPVEVDVTIPPNLVDAIAEKDLPSNFGEGVDSAMFSIGNFREESKAYLNVIKICGSDITSTNNRSITSFKMDSSIEDTLYIPSYAAKHMSVVNPDKYCIEGGWLAFYNTEQDVLFACRTIDAAKFPDLGGFISKIDEGKEITFSKKLFDSLEATAIFFRGLTDPYHVASIKNDGNDLTVRVENKNGQFEEKIESECSEEFIMAVNPKYLLRTLKKDPKVSLCGGGAALKIEKENCVILINVSNGG